MRVIAIIKNLSSQTNIWNVDRIHDELPLTKDTGGDSIATCHYEFSLLAIEVFLMRDQKGLQLGILDSPN